MPTIKMGTDEAHISDALYDEVTEYLKAGEKFAAIKALRCSWETRVDRDSLLEFACNSGAYACRAKEVLQNSSLNMRPVKDCVDAIEALQSTIKPDIREQLRVYLNAMLNEEPMQGDVFNAFKDAYAAVCCPRSATISIPDSLRNALAEARSEACAMGDLLWREAREDRKEHWNVRIPCTPSLRRAINAVLAHLDRE